MLTANEYLANIYQVLTKIDRKLENDNSKGKGKEKPTKESKAATQGMGFNLGEMAKNPQAIGETAKGLKTLGEALKILSVATVKFWMVPKAAKSSLIDFISSLSFTTSKNRLTILHGMVDLSVALQTLSSGIWKFWLVPKSAKNALIDFIKALSGSKKESTGATSQIMTAASDITALSIALKRMNADPKKIAETSKSLSSLFKVLSNFGKKDKEIKNITNMADSLTKAFKEINQTAKNMAILFLGIGGAILIIATALYLSGKMLGDLKPAAVLGVLALTVLTIVGVFWILGKAGPKVKEGAETGKAMGEALLYISGGILAFVLSLKAIAALLGTGDDSKGIMKAGLMVVGIVAIFSGIFWLLGKFGKNIKEGADIAKAMGIGLLFLAGGLLGIALIAKIFSKMENPIKDVLAIAIIVAALAGIFYLMGKNWKMMLIGTGVMIAFSIGIFLLSLALKPVMDIANMIEKMKTPGKTFATLGLVLAALIGIFALVGQPEVAAVVALGAAVISAMVVPFLLLAVTLNKFADATKKFMEIAQSYDIKQVKPTVSGLIEGVIGGFTDGFKKALGGGKSGIAAVLAAAKNATVIYAGIGLLMGVSVSLSKFAEALSAFASLDNMRVIEGTDKDGKPIFGDKINVKAVGQNLSTTIASFLVSLIDSTSKLTKQQGPAIRKMARALTGKRGMLTAVIGFAEAIKTYAEFGNGNVIGVELYETGKKDEDGNPIFAERKTSTPITTVVENMVTSFSTFITSLADNVDKFAKLASGGPLSPVKRVARMLTGKRGILAGVIGFAEALKMYSQFGADNVIPVLDAEGQPVLDANKKPKVIPMEQVAKNIVTSLSTFSEVLAGALDKDDRKNARQAKGTLKKFDDLIEQFNKLATAQEGLAKVSATIGLLAQNIGLLSTNLNSLDPKKFDTLTNASIKANASISKDAIIADKASKISASNNSSNVTNYNTTNVNSAAQAKAEKEKQTPPINEENLAKLIGIQVAAAMGSKQWRFEFATDKSGIMTIS